MELNNMNLPKKVYADRGHRHCAPQEDLERLADDMALLAEAIRKGIALDGYGAMRKLTEKVLHELSEHACGRDYTNLSGEHSHSLAHSHTAMLGHSHMVSNGDNRALVHSHSLPQDRSEEDERPCGCRCPLEGDAFYDELCEQLKVKLDEQILETIKSSRGLQEHQIPLVHSHSIPNYSDEEIAEMRRMYVHVTEPFEGRE